LAYNKVTLYQGYTITRLHYKEIKPH